MESEAAGQIPAAVLRSIQSSKATSMFPSRRFSPAISSLFIRKNMYSSSSTLLSESVNAIIAWVCGMSIMNYLAWGRARRSRLTRSSSNSQQLLSTQKDVKTSSSLCLYSFKVSTILFILLIHFQLSTIQYSFPRLLIIFADTLARCPHY